MTDQEKNQGSTASAATPSTVGTPNPAPEQPKQEETIQVPVSKLQAMFDKLEGLEGRLDAKDKEIAVLNETVSKQRLDETKARLDMDKRKRVHFKKLNGKVVIGWPETVGEDKKNEWIFSPSNPTSPVGEILKCRYYLLDGTKSDMVDQIQLSRSTEQVFARVLEDLGDYAVVQFEDESVSKEPLKIHKKFLNA